MTGRRCAKGNKRVFYIRGLLGKQMLHYASFAVIYAVIFLHLATFDALAGEEVEPAEYALDVGEEAAFANAQEEADIEIGDPDAVTMQKYGLLVGAPVWHAVDDSEYTKAYFTTNDLKAVLYYEVYCNWTECLGWKDTDGEIKPIPLGEIDRLRAYDAEGCEVSDWVFPKTSRNGGEGMDEPDGDGLYYFQFKTPGQYRIVYDGRDIPDGTENMTNDVTVNVHMPEAAVYSADAATIENLVLPNSETGAIEYSDDERMFYVVPSENVIEGDRKRVVSLSPEEYYVYCPPGELTDEWEDKLSIEDCGNGCIKITVAPGIADRIGLEFTYVTGVYRRGDDGEEWVLDYPEFGSCVFELAYKPSFDISHASISGISLSYGYTGRAYTPAFNVLLGGKVLEEGTDYTYKFRNNRNPGTATLTITGRGNYTGTRVKKFEIVDCVPEPIDGETYQLIPKNNTKTAVCSFSGKMVNNTKVYITDRSSSEAMKFVAVKQKDGSWKFINAKCELALAVQQNSTKTGKGLVLYNQTTRQAQTWKLSGKSDHSFAIVNAVSGLSIAMSDASAVKGTALFTAEPAGTGLQRFYLVEADPVANPYSGTYAVQASGNRDFALNVRSSSITDGANVNLYGYDKSKAQRFLLRHSGGGYYRIENANSGLVVTVKGNTKADGANVIQSAWAAESGQRWKVKKNPDGTVTFMNALGTVLHLSGNKTANNTNVVAKKASATGAQRWYLG